MKCLYALIFAYYVSFVRSFGLFYFMPIFFLMLLIIGRLSGRTSDYGMFYLLYTFVFLTLGFMAIASALLLAIALFRDGEFRKNVYSGSRNYSEIKAFLARDY